MKLWPGVRFPSTISIEMLCTLAGNHGRLESSYVNGSAIVAVDHILFIRWQRLPANLKQTLREVLESKTPMLTGHQFQVLHHFMERVIL